MIFDQLARKIKSSADCFRLGREAAASEALIEITDAMTTLISEWPEREISTLNTWLGRLFVAQEQKNYLFVADILEYEVLPFFVAQKAVVKKGDQG